VLARLGETDSPVLCDLLCLYHHWQNDDTGRYRSLTVRA
jgi:hypothetical protein